MRPRLVDAGVQPGERVGLLSENRVEWLVADLAIMAAGAVNVPLHAPLTAAQIQYQLGDAGAAWLFVSTAAQLDKVKAVRSQLPAAAGRGHHGGRQRRRDGDLALLLAARPARSFRPAVRRWLAARPGCTR